MTDLRRSSRARSASLRSPCNCCFRPIRTYPRRLSFIVCRRLLRSLAAFFRLRITLGFSKNRRRRTSDITRSPCTFLLKRLNRESKDSPFSTVTRVTYFPPLIPDPGPVLLVADRLYTCPPDLSSTVSRPMHPPAPIRARLGCPRPPEPARQSPDPPPPDERQ
jgi:hypothetical protein